jgi:hypothetical protein
LFYLCLGGRLRVHFLCLPKAPTGHDKKSPKERTPDDLPANAGTLRFSESEGFSDGPSLARQRTRDILVAPLRAIPPIPAMLGGVNGTKKQNSVRRVGET